MKARYRIREDISGSADRNYRGSGWSLITHKKYIVERRLCFFWWYQESKQILYLEDGFSTYKEAIEYIAKRDGKLLYIC
jgi:hypothetical protein